MGAGLGFREKHGTAANGDAFGPLYGLQREATKRMSDARTIRPVYRPLFTYQNKGLGSFQRFFVGWALASDSFFKCGPMHNFTRWYARTARSGTLNGMTKRDTQRNKVLELSRDGNLSLSEIGKRVGVAKTTCARWIRRYGQESDTPVPVAVSEPSSDAGTDPDRPDVVDFENIEFLKEERARLYAALSQGYDRSAAIQLAMINKDLRELRTCEDHWELEDTRRLCASLNGLWLRHLEIAERELKQIGYTDAIRILDKAIEKVRVEAETLS